MSHQLNEDIYAKVFVSTTLEREDLTELIRTFSVEAVRAKFFEINTNEISVDVRKNEFYDPHKTSFVNFPYYLDVNPFVGINEDRFLKALAKLMAFFKQNGFEAITACDDEDTLAALVGKELGLSTGTE